MFIAKDHLENCAPYERHVSPRFQVVPRKAGLILPIANFVQLDQPFGRHVGVGLGKAKPLVNPKLGSQCTLIRRFNLCRATHGSPTERMYRVTQSYKHVTPPE